MKTFYLLIIFIFCYTICLSAQEGAILIDDFENPVSGGPEGTVDFGAGGGSSLTVKGSSDIKKCGNQSIEVIYDAVPGGYMWIAKGVDLDAKNTAWLIEPGALDWTKFSAISFSMYGSNSGASIAFDVKDNGREIWRFMVGDNFTGWKKIVIPFSEFFVRNDWQSDNADKNNTLDFPLKSFQFEPRPEAKGTVYFDCVELVKK
jgi:hypothetical protein